MPFSGMRLALNTYFVTLGVRELGLSHLEAGAALACRKQAACWGGSAGVSLSHRNSARLVLIGSDWE